MPDGTKKLGMWENGKRISWLEDEDLESIKPAGWDDYKKQILPEKIDPKFNDTKTELKDHI